VRAAEAKFYLTPSAVSYLPEARHQDICQRRQPGTIGFRGRVTCLQRSKSGGEKHVDGILSLYVAARMLIIPVQNTNRFIAPPMLGLATICRGRPAAEFWRIARLWRGERLQLRAREFAEVL